MTSSDRPAEPVATEPDTGAEFAAPAGSAGVAGKHNAHFSNRHSARLHRLDVRLPKTRDGRRIATWSFRSASADSKTAKPVEIEVYFVGAEGRLQLEARSPRLPAPLRDSDLDRLRERVFTTLAHQAALQANGTWEDWLEVRISGSNGEFSRHSGLGGYLSLAVNRLKRGIDPATGEPVTVNSHGVVVPFPTPKAMGEAPPAEGWVEQDEEERAYVRETPAMLAALEDLRDRIRAVRQGLAQLLSQGAAEETLSRGALRQLLHVDPAGERAEPPAN